MDPPTSFKLPILIKKRLQNQSLSPRVLERLNSSLAFKETEAAYYNTKNIHEISPRLGMRLNPGYRMEYTLARSEMKNQYPNHYKQKPYIKKPITDTIFFKKKDDLVNYAESFFRNKVLYSKK
jgi:hypothetical protein